jgi:hypothetical protein
VSGIGGPVVIDQAQMRPVNPGGLRLLEVIEMSSAADHLREGLVDGVLDRR